METYSRDLADELKKLVDLEVQALPGRASGEPPSVAGLAFFFLKLAVLLTGKRRLDWDVVHFGDFVLFPLARLHAIRARAKRRVITVHGLDVIYGNRAGWKPKLYRSFMAWARSQRECIDAIIVNSRNTGRLALEAGVGQPAVIPLGTKGSSAEHCEVMPVSEEDPYILFVGRLVPRKGAAWFASEVLPLLPDSMTFKVVGNPWDAAEVRKLDELPRVQRLGFVDDHELAELRAGAVATVMPNVPSLNREDVEGFGIAALEAALGGSPLLAADLEGIPDAVVDGRTGFLLPPRDPAAWVSAVLEVANWSQDQRREFAHSAKIIVEERFSWRRVAEDTLEVYQRLVGSRK